MLARFSALALPDQPTPHPAEVLSWPLRLPTIPTPAGQLHLRPLTLADIPLLIHWCRDTKATYWGLQSATDAAITAIYRQQITNDHQCPLLGLIDQSPICLVELYNPAQDPLAAHYTPEDGDIGLHFLMAPAQAKPQAGLTGELFAQALAYVSRLAGAKRLVVEPDINNRKIHKLNRAAGFQYCRPLHLPHKSAWLAFLPFEPDRVLSFKPANPLQHLNANDWAWAHRHLTAKAMSEFCHEKLLSPDLWAEAESGAIYQLTSADGHYRYSFHADRLALDHWLIREDSLAKCRVDNQTVQPLDALAFIAEFRSQLGIAPAQIGTYLDEISSTLFGAAYKHRRAALAPALSAKALALANFQTLEAAMTEGHPGFVANNGRIGFTLDDYRRYAPETEPKLTLAWCAAHKNRAHLSLSEDLQAETLYREELGPEQIACFEQRLRQQGLDPSNYWWMPVHPWQWQNKLAISFSTEIASGHLVYLGETSDCYQPQQSIRTFFNHSAPYKRYVKVSLSILNMGFMRGLSPHFMEGTPAICDWIGTLLNNDAYLQGCGFHLLKEVAAIGYQAPHYEAAITENNAFKKQLSALWRESPLTYIAEGEQLMTMAALLHRDADDKSLLAAVISASGESPTRWLDAYLRVYIKPLLHAFYQHSLIFMPHGENVILRLTAQRPTGIFLKDIAEEAGVLNPQITLPPLIQRISTNLPDDLKTLCFFIDVMDGFLRHLAAVFFSDLNMATSDFWERLACCIHDYQADFPELAGEFNRYDLFAERFAHSCLNRLQLANNQHMLNLEAPADSLQYAGFLANPLAPFKHRGSK